MLEHPIAERLNEERMTGAELHEPVARPRQIAEPPLDRLRDKPAGVIERKCTDSDPVAETEESGSVLLAQSLQPAGARDDRAQTGLVLQQVTEVLGDLRTRDSGINTLVQLVELVQHEQNSPWAGRLDR